MSNLTMNSNAESSNLSVPKLCDNGSNWANYKPRLRKAMGSKGLWRHVEGVAVALKLYVVAYGIPVLSDGKMLGGASDQQSVEYSVMLMCNPRSIVNDQGADPLSTP